MLPITPVLCGYKPVIIDARLGEHWGVVANEYSNTTDEDARASIFGVSKESSTEPIAW
jgi:hypothetical protein